MTAQHELITIPFAFVHGMLDGVRRHGLDCDDFLLAAGISPRLAVQAGARVTASQYIALFQLIIIRCDDEMLGLLQRPMRRGSYALMVRDATRSSRLGSAIERINRTFSFFQDDLALTTLNSHRAIGVALRFQHRPRPTSLFLHELLLRVFWRLLAWLAGGNLPALRFDFAYPRPAYAEHYARIFPAERRFNQRESAFWIASDCLDIAVDREQAALRAYLAAAERNVIVPWRGDDVVSRRVRHYLQASKTEWPGLEQTAQALNMSSATLQRRLGEENSTFQFVKDELRRDMAIVRLNTSDASLQEIAHDLGFADSSGFQRSFKRWTGSPTGAYRRR